MSSVGIQAPIKMQVCRVWAPLRCFIFSVIWPHITLSLTPVNTFEKIVAFIFEGRKTGIVPGKHNENTKLLGFFADLDLVARIDQTREGKARSQFLRDATVEYLI